MPRYIRNTVILAKTEVTPGTDSIPTGAANALLVSEVTITPLEAQNIDRALIRAYFGASEQLVGTAFKRVQFTVELAGSGTAGTAPAWGPLLTACAFAEAVLATPARVEYTPVSTSLKTLTIYYHDDGVLHKLLGAMGNVKLSAKAGDRPKLTFDFMGVDGGDSATANATPTLTAWKTPVAMTKANVVDIKLGPTYAAGVLSAGTLQKSTGVEIDLANSVNFTPTLSEESVDITDRQASGSVQFDLTAAQEVANMTTVKANTLQSLGMEIGTVSGNKLMLFAPAVQLLPPRKEEVNGRRFIGYDLRITPLAGNDELRIIHL